MRMVLKDKSLTIDQSEFNASAIYNLEDLSFWVDKKTCSAGIQVFLQITDSRGLKDIVELARNSLNDNYAIYKVPINQKLRIQKDKVSVNLIIFYTGNNLYNFSTPCQLLLKSDNYEMTRQIHLASEISTRIELLYAKIMQKGSNIDDCKI